jgi:hypothetical protein
MTLLEEIKEMDRDGFIADIQRFCQVSKDDDALEKQIKWD